MATNPQQIEEFRRKLREGRPVRVVGGDIVIDPRPGVAPAPPAGDGPMEAPQGVQVKPHTWGVR